jgi:hypothetical protein
MVLDWNSESSKLVPPFWVLALVARFLDLKHKFDHSSWYTILSPLCEACLSLKGKLFYATKENTELQQEVTYLTARLEKTILSEKMIEDLSRVEESDQIYIQIGDWV